MRLKPSPWLAANPTEQYPRAGAFHSRPMLQRQQYRHVSRLRPFERRFYKSESFNFLVASTQGIRLTLGLFDKLRSCGIRHPDAQQLHAALVLALPVTLEFIQSRWLCGGQKEPRSVAHYYVMTRCALPEKSANSLFFFHPFIPKIQTYPVITPPAPVRSPLPFATARSC